MKRKNKSYYQYRQSMFNKYSIDEGYLQTGKQRRACLELLEKIDTNQEIDDKSMIEKIAAAFHGTALHKKVASCITVAALLTALQSTPAMALASNDYQPKAETYYSEVLPGSNVVKIDSDSYLDLAGSSVFQEVRSSSLHLFSNKTLANNFDPMQANGVLIDDDSDVALFPAQETKTLTVIDTDLADWEVLRDAVNEGEILLLDDEADPLDAILTKLQEMGTVDCLNIVSHGESGKLKFENSVIDSKSLDTNKDQWAEISSHISSDGDIQLYGCNIAKGDEGKAFMEKLAQVTGADIAASINPTGSESKGGDWTLEAVVGDVAANLPFAKDAIGKFMSILLPAGAADAYELSYDFTDNGDTLSNSYFLVSATVNGSPASLEQYSFYGARTTATSSGTVAIKIEANGTALGTFRLSSIKIFAEANVSNLTNVKIVGHYSGGTVTATDTDGVHNSDTSETSDFTNFNNLSIKDLDYFIIYADATNVQALQLFSFNVDNMTVPVLGPTATITVNDTALSVGETSLVTITFSEAVTGFTNADLTVANGTLSNVSSSDGGTTWTATFTPTADIEDTSNVITLDQTGVKNGADTPGVGTASSNNYAIDTKFPSAPSTPDLTTGSDTGSSTTDNITNDTTPTFTGTAEAGSTVTLYDSDGTTVLGTATAAGGNWSITSSTLAAGAHTLTAKATDAAGNTGLASSSLSVTVDTTAPSAPSAPDLTAGTDAGTSDTDNTTSNTTPTFTGTAEAGSTVKLYDSDGTTVLGTATATGGNWSITSSTLGAGTHTLTAKATDAAGNTSAASSGLSVTIDTTAPTITFSGLTLSADTGSSSTDFITRTAAQTISAALSGTLDASDRVFGSLDNGSTWTDITGKVSGTTLTWGGVTISGSSTLQLKVVDIAGNSGTILNQPYTLDMTAPTITFSGLSFSGDTGSSGTDFITNTAAQTIRATLSGAPGGTDKVYGSLDNGSTWTDITSKVSGTTLTWNGVTLAGSNTLKLKVEDAAGNTGAIASQGYVLDTIAPTITFSGLALSADTGSSSTDFITNTSSQTISATLSGSLSGADEVYGSLDNGTTWTNITSKVSGTTLTWDGVTLPGSNTLKLKVADAAGNSGTIASQAYTLDTTAPTITFSGLALSADTGSSSTDFITSTAAQTISATLSGALGTDKVYGSLDNGTTWTDITSKVSGTLLSWDGVTLAGSNSLKLKVVDTAGNDGTITSKAYVLATSAPTTTITAIAFSVDTGSSSTDFVTGTASQTISGTLSSNLASGEIVEVSLNNGSTWTTAAATVGQNTWSLAGQTLTASNTMKVRVTSLAGLSGTERSQAYVLDTTAPTITINGLALSADTGSSNSDFITSTVAQTISATLSGALGAYDIVYGSLDNGTTWTNITSKVSGTTLTWDGVTLSGSNTLKLKVVDAAGNSGTIASQAYTLDTTAPTITFSGLALSADTGSSSTDFITSTAAQTISATLSGALGTDKVYGSLDNGSTWTDITAKVSGTTLTWNGVTLASSNTLQLKVVDAAGNTGAIASKAYVFDTIAPSAPSVNSTSTSTNDATPTWTWTTGGGGSGSYRYRLDNSDLTVGATNTASASYTPGLDLSEGNHTLYVQEQDDSGNWSATGSFTVSVDTNAPTAGGGGTIAASDATSNSVKLTWTAGTDALTAQADLKYKVVSSTSDITTVSAAESATLAQDWTAAISTYTVAGLSPSTDYYFNVLVKDAAGNKSLYTAVTSKTAIAPASGGGHSGGGSTPTGTTGTTVVEVNGQKQDAGTATNGTTSGGQTVTTIKVDDTKLGKLLDSSGSQPKVTLPGSGSDVVVGELNGQTVKSMEQKDATLEIKTGTATYTLPASQINIDSISEQIGSQIDLKDIKVSVKIAEPPADTVRIVEDAADKNSFQLVVKPIEFEITCTNGNKTIGVSKFNGYVERTVAIPDGVDPSRITTGVVLNANGTVTHVPTQIIKVGGKYYAKINSLTNSVYSVVYNPVTFSDVSGHWAKDAVNNMGSRMVVAGTGKDAYTPDRSITRAEFAAIVVRALGLQQGTSESSFTDVALTNWFNGYVDTATDYDLITGYNKASFKPNDTITREQAMAILARAMKLTGLEISLNESDTAALLSDYTDGAKVSAYAKESVAACIKAGVVSGSSKTTLSPKASVTRAEVAAMIQRLLEKSNLI